MWKYEMKFDNSIHKHVALGWIYRILYQRNVDIDEYTDNNTVTVTGDELPRRVRDELSKMTSPPNFQEVEL